MPERSFYRRNLRGSALRRAASRIAEQQDDNCKPSAREDSRSSPGSHIRQAVLGEGGANERRSRRRYVRKAAFTHPQARLASESFKGKPMLRLMIGMLAIAATPALPAAFDKMVPASITVEWAHGPRAKLVADQLLWRCSGHRCTGRVTDRPQILMRTCRRLARAGGRITAFELPRGPMSEGELVRCNQGLNNVPKAE